MPRLYQMQINNELRAVMERESANGASAKRTTKASRAAMDYSALLDDPQFIAAVAERVRQSRQRGRKTA